MTKTLEEVCEEATANFTTGYDAGLRMLRAARQREISAVGLLAGPRAEAIEESIKQFEDQRQAAIDSFRRRCMELGGPPPMPTASDFAELEMMLPFFRQQRPGPALPKCTMKDEWLSWLFASFDALGRSHPPQLVARDPDISRIAESLAEALDTIMGLPCGPPELSKLFGQVGRAAGAAIGAGVAVAAAKTPAAAPIGAAVGAEIGAAVEEAAVAEGRKERQAKYGDLAFEASFTGREAATNLARLYQENTGEGAFVYYDPVKERWMVELGQPTETERRLLAQGRIEKILPGEKPPRDPRKSFLLVFPPAPTFSSDDRPSLLDAAVFGGRVLPEAEPQAPCDCATIPDTGKKLCTRTGVLGILRQEQIPALCSEIHDLPDGRVERSKALRDAQGICGTLVEDIEDLGERFGARFTCLRDALSGVPSV